MSTSRTPRAAVLGLTVGALAAGSLVVAPAALAAPADARITEIHYDNNGTDTGEAIEITAPTAADLTGLSVVLYNGNDGAVYDTDPVPASANGISVVNYPANGVQNGASDAIALVDANGTVVDFVSYEGTLTAANGPAAGLTAPDIGVAELGTDPAGVSLQRTPGTDTWTGPSPSSFGAANGGTTEPEDPPGSVTPADTDAHFTEIHYDNDGADADEAIEVTASSAANLAGLSVVLYNGGNGAMYGTAPVAVGTTGISVVEYAGIQNGAPDGFALVASNGRVLEFLSYEGVLTAVDGPAVGLTSTDIGVAETATTPVGQSLQRTPGTDIWTGPATSSFGAANGGTPPPSPDPQCEAEGAIAIGRVQGAGTATPCTGETVTVEGIVVGDLQDGGFSGFFVQDSGDGDANTSDGLFVYAPDGAQVAPGDRVTVTGTAGDVFDVTQLSDATYTVTGSGALPAATPLPLPSTDAEREALEGMLVEPTESLTVTEVFNLSNYGELLLAQGGRLISPTEAADPGPDSTAAAQQNDLRSIVLDDGRTTDFSPEDAPLLQPPYLTLNDPVRVGDTAVLEPVVLHQGFGSYRLQPSDGTADGMTFTATNPRPEAPAAVGGDLKIADFNVLNYFVTFGGESRGAPNEEEKEQQEAKIVSAMLDLDADIFTLHEIENSTVTTPEDPYRAVRTLVEALAERGGGTWNWVEAAEDTDVITNAIIYRPDRVTAVGDPVTPTSPEATAAFSNARSPIGQTFEKNGETFTVITNHFKSKGSACATADNDRSFGGAGNCNGNRVRQSEALRDFAAEVTTAVGDPDVLLTGDFNAYRYEDPIDVLRNAGYVDMGPLLAEGQYSYVFDGGSGSLDHVLASPSLAEKITGLTIWDINSVESFAYEYGGYEPLYAPYEFRASDHNPTLIGLAAPAPDVPEAATISDDRPLRGDRVTVTGTGFTPGQTVTATLASRSATLGTGVADANGTVSISFTVPVFLPQGQQDVVLTGGAEESATTSFTLWPAYQDALLWLLRVFRR